ncbi:hypothetical protein K443DRAFT_673714 [Laccaria amethystina LaAM-08-1]|uniref:Uncharacterized protein n=1 Tax=Laccaria amethystina LaAM-08-1 TaxID=1095629 RepID=A0A0C9X4P8_9AGAR|nr:hypothetical protein K443DRAFT_673714 [Laccaria amethystina LaAM-08-1]
MRRSSLSPTTKKNHRSRAQLKHFDKIPVPRNNGTQSSTTTAFHSSIISLAPKEQGGEWLVICCLETAGRG